MTLEQIVIETSHYAEKWFNEIYSKYEKKYSDDVNNFLRSESLIGAYEELNNLLKENIGNSIHENFPSLNFQLNTNLFKGIDLPISLGYPSSIPKSIKDEITNEELIVYYNALFDAFLHRYFLLGKQDIEMAKVLFTYRNGYNALSRHLKQETWKELEWQLDSYNRGIYGIQNTPCNVKILTKWKSEGQVYDVWLANFKINRSKQNNFYKGPLLYLKLDDVDLEDFIIDKCYVDDYLQTFNAAENSIRTMRGLPKVGEGWISETKLYYQIKEKFGDQTTVIHHGRPKWLGRQHFDIYLPEYNLAIEYQGTQHYEPISIFGGKEGFIKTVNRDELKREKSIENNCTLVYVDEGYKLEEVLEEIGKYIFK